MLVGLFGLHTTTSRVATVISAASRQVVAVLRRAAPDRRAPEAASSCG